MPERAALYIDGFNIYHALHEMGESFLKWANYWRLGELIIPGRSQTLVKVVYCTAFYPGDERKQWRHEQFKGAQQANGVTVVMGHYVYEDWDCRQCGHAWKKPTEKEGDINVAIHLIRDGMNDAFDHAYLLSADSDQAATARMFRELFPGKTLTSVAPPGRNFSTHITKYAHHRIAITREHIERCVMPPVVFRPGVANVRMPREYAPPADWVPPTRRPR